MVEEGRHDWESAVIDVNARLADRCDIEFLDLAGVPAELVMTPGIRSDTLVVLVHGGGFNAGSPRTHRELAVRLARTAGMPVAVPAYRLAPEHPCPAAAEDVVAVLRALADRGHDLARLAIVGDSAGAGVALASVVALRDAGDQLPAAVALLSPWVDLTLSGPSIVSHAAIDPMTTQAGLAWAAGLYLADMDPANPLASPLFAEMSGLPPMVIHAGSREILLSDALRLADRVAIGGGEVRLRVWKSMSHVFQASADLPEAQEALEDVGRFIRDAVYMTGRT
jgi:acetyl esterase/lipase